MNWSNKIWMMLAFAMMASACELQWEPAFHERAAPGQFGTVVISDIREALTFARIGENVQRRVIAVTRYQDGWVDGVDLSNILNRDADDPIAVYLEYGYEALRHIIAHAPPTAMVSVRAANLVIPIDLSAHHIAAGLNFPEHAGETRVKEGPFLFPKLVEPTEPTAKVSKSGGLLDYEAEFAWVPIKPIYQDQEIEEIGLILCNDYTDRATLLRHVDVDDVASGRGFTTGKSFSGFLPVGNLFVIPRDWRDFTRDLVLQLYVNHGLRQRLTATDMIWDFDRIIDETWKRRRKNWLHKGQPVSLLVDSQLISDRVLIMSGTSHGVVFRGVPMQQKIVGFFGWLMGGWDRSIPTHAIEAYIHDAKAEQIYLQPGDRVVIHVDRLGVIDNLIAPEGEESKLLGNGKIGLGRY